MRRVFLILLGIIGAAVVAFVAWALLTPLPAPVTVLPSADAESTAPLQADAEGYYVPGFSFTLGYFRFAGITLRPKTYVTFTQTTTGTKREIGCVEAVIEPDAVQLRCDDEQVGEVSVDGRFLNRVATTRLDTPVLSAVVTIRTREGEVRYRSRDSFMWHPVD